LQSVRANRNYPDRNDQVLTDWNGMAISALAKAALIYNNPKWLAASKEAFDFVLKTLGSEDKLFHSWTLEGVGTGEILDDYAHMIFAAISLYECTGEEWLLAQAQAWVGVCISDFRDGSTGAFYQSPLKSGLMFARIKHGCDSVVPSANGVLARCLAHLYSLTGIDRYREVAEDILSDLAQFLDRDRYQMASLLDAARLLSNTTKVKIVSCSQNVEMPSLLLAAFRSVPVHSIIQFTRAQGDSEEGVQSDSDRRTAGHDTAYVCVDQTCSLPIRTSSKLVDVLKASGDFRV
jgi:uncharacterized protein YyaL (SSP411 family)